MKSLRSRFLQLWQRRRETRRIAFLRRRLAALGMGAVIGEPIDALTNPESISIGSRFYSRGHLRLEAVPRVPGAEPGTLVIGDDVHFEGFCSVSAAAEVRIGDSVLFGANVTVRDHDHGFQIPRMHRIEQPLICAPVQIGEFAWISQNAVILKGVTLGDHVVVGANAVVTQSFESWAIVGGVPARQIGWADGRPFLGSERPVQGPATPAG